MSAWAQLTWQLRRRFWTRWQLLRFRLSKPQHIGPPVPTTEHLRVVPLGEVYPAIPLRDVLTVEQIPSDEAPLRMRALINTGLALGRCIPQMRPGLPEIADDPRTALDDAGIAKYASAFRSPVRPSVYDTDGPPDLGRLAVESPYAVFLERDDEGTLQWDFRELAEFEHHDGLCSLGLRVLFSERPRTRDLVVERIESVELGTVTPDDDTWPRANQLAVTAATTHAALSRHFAAVHLISGNHWDVATRNQLPVDHALHRLLRPHVFNSFYTNYGVTRAQMLPAGDFVNVYSFTPSGMAAYFDAAYRSYDITVTDPVADWARRGLGAESFDTPTHDNLVELFELAHAHTARYVDAYFESDEQLRGDPAVAAWIRELAELVPNGLGGVETAPTKSGLARLIAGYISEGSVIHDLVGTTLWDYQLWADKNPTRVPRDGTRVSLDVFQRMINNNFALQLRRAPLLADYGSVALDERGASLFTQFFDECRRLQERYDALPGGPWRMEPANLEINMNG